MIRTGFEKKIPMKESYANKITKTLPKLKTAKNTLKTCISAQGIFKHVKHSYLGHLWNP